MIALEILLPTRFYLAQLAPNGKIYISVPPNSSEFICILSTIPDSAGLACNVEATWSESLPTRNGFSMPNFPNYRLGALEG